MFECKYMKIMFFIKKYISLYIIINKSQLGEKKWLLQKKSSQDQ